MLHSANAHTAVCACLMVPSARISGTATHRAIMRTHDYIIFAGKSLLKQRFRSFMLLAAIAIGVTAVTVLTAIGEGAKRYVENEFSFLGKDVVIVLPGRKETTGGLPPLTGSTARDLTLEDAEQLRVHVHGVEDVAPLVIGAANIRNGNLGRDSMVIGTNHAFFTIRQLVVAQGQPLPAGDIKHPAPYAVIGGTLRQALFGNRPVIGERIQVGDRRFVIIGELQGKGDASGMDLSEVLMVPVASAQSLFNINGLFRIIIQVRPNTDRKQVEAEVMRIMTERHHGKPDITLVTPDAMLATLGDILNVLTLGVAAIAGISLLVAGILVMNVMLINVRQRTQEIGLLKALGASSRAIQGVFLTEALLTAASGAVIGYGSGAALIELA
ncbi:MAG: ABC transporter permease, partial [Gammaproteobacteria bacterium]